VWNLYRVTYVTFFGFDFKGRLMNKVIRTHTTAAQAGAGSSTAAGDFAGKVAFVTGAGSGIGKAAALLFARRGAQVALVGRRSAELERVAEEVRSLAKDALVLAGDVACEDDVERAVTSTVSTFGRLDACFNNTGVEGAFAPIWTLAEADFDHTIGINLKGVWLSAKHEIAAMRSLGAGGAIVNTSSWLAHGAFPGSSIYSASKAALDGMIRALAQEVADQGIRVNNVSPGIIDTPMFRRFADDDSAKPFIDHTPQRRLGTPDDVAEVVAWLCSTSARFVTGQNVLVDGGYAIPGHRAWASASASQPATDLS
jgi:NAD(P)-dependent dehydrogenase (short-subunit alcohol dehydrogenase family)